MTHYLRHLDYLMLATVLSISAFGLWIMQTATANYAGNLYGHQLLYVVVGTVGMLAIAAVPPALMRRARWPLYALRAAQHRRRARGRDDRSAAAAAGSTWARSSSSRPSSPSCS